MNESCHACERVMSHMHECRFVWGLLVNIIHGGVSHMRHVTHLNAHAWNDCLLRRLVCGIRIVTSSASWHIWVMSPIWMRTCDIHPKIVPQDQSSRLCNKNGFSFVWHEQKMLCCRHEYCSVLQCVAVCCSLLQNSFSLIWHQRKWSCCEYECRSVSHCVAMCCNLLQRVAERFLSYATSAKYVMLWTWVLQGVVMRCSVLQCVAEQFLSHVTSTKDIML